jgi:hypothetical protein
MRRFIVGIAGLPFLMFLLATNSRAQATRTFTGEITDEHLNCFQTPMKAPEGIKQKDAFILYWAHYATPPSKYVLYDPGSKTTYQLDDQAGIQPFIGAKVIISGAESNGMIKVSEIKVDEKAYKAASEHNSGA